MTFRPALVPLEDRATPTTLPAGFTETVIATGLTKASALAVVPDGRVLVAEQGGTLRVVTAAGTVPTPALTLAVDPAGERGLIGVTPAPDFPTTGHVYLYYTVPAANGAAPFNRVSRFTLAGDTADPASEVVVVNLDPLGAATNHNGGGLRFGPDGKLYVAVGDNAAPANAQSAANRLGKVLRLNPDGSVPADNPTAVDGIGPTSGANRGIWAAGLRNPYTLDVDPGTGEVFINDVGQASFEEVNRGRAGANFGWPATEGAFDPATFPQFTNPVVSYPHGGTAAVTGNSITGGAFLSAAAERFPAEYVGDYFFVDLNGGTVGRRDRDTGAVTAFATGVDAASPLVTGAAVTPAGDLLYMNYGPAPGDGKVLRISYTAPGFRLNASRPVVALAAAAGGGSVVVVTDPTTGTELARFSAFEDTFTGGVRAATADVTGDRVPDVIAGAGPGGGPRVRVFDGATGDVVRDFFAFEPTFTGGVTVTAADVTGDGRADIVVGADEGGGPRIRILDGGTGGTVADFFAFETAFTGGVRVSAADVSGDTVPDLRVAAGPGGGPRIARFDGAGLRANRVTRIGADTFAFDPNLRGGATVALGDIDGDGVTDAVTAAGPGGGPRVRVESGRTGATLADFFAGDAADRSGVTVAVRAGRVVVGRTAGTAVAYRVADGVATFDRDLPRFPGFLGGVSVG